MADLCFCLHYLLQEVMLADAIFGSRNQTLLNITRADQHYCLSIRILVSVSTNGIMLTALAIAFATFCSFYHCRYGDQLIKGFIVFSWVACLVIGAVAFWLFKMYYRYPETEIDRDTLSLLVVFGCVEGISLKSSLRNLHYDAIATSINVLASIVVCILYFCLWFKIKKSTSRQFRNKEINRFRIRLIVISILNLLCWWPVLAVYLYESAKNETEYDGSFTLVGSELILLTTAAASAANPIIYTIATKEFFRRACSCCKKKRRLIFVNENDRMYRGCCALCRQWFDRCRRKKPGIPVDSLTEDTEESSLFTETE
jgi:hypothetical protein